MSKVVIDAIRWDSDVNFIAFLTKECRKKITQLWLREQIVFLVWVPLDIFQVVLILLFIYFFLMFPFLLYHGWFFLFVCFASKYLLPFVAEFLYVQFLNI